MKTIPLTQGMVAVVDDEAYEWLSLFTWYFSGTGYAVRDVKANKKRTSIYMHRLIADAEEGKEVDHINGNKLDNTKGNLRICERYENACNVKPRAGCASKYKGVYWDDHRKQWRVDVNSKPYGKVHVGSFYSEDEAGLAYNLVAKTLQGDFAFLNEIPSDVSLPFKHKVERKRSSEHVGVSFDKTHTGRWSAYIDKGGRRIWSSRFKTEELAHQAREQKLKELGLA